MALKVSACGCVPVNNMHSAEVTPWVAYINREDRGASQVDSRRDPSTCPRDPSKRNALKCSLTSSRTAGILCFYARFRKCLEPRCLAKKREEVHAAQQHAENFPDLGGVDREELGYFLFFD